MPKSAVPMAQKALIDFDGFSEDDRNRIGWTNAFELFPSLREKFPDIRA